MRPSIVALPLLLLNAASASNLQPGPYPHYYRSEPEVVDDVDPAELYPPYNLSVPVDHFHNDSRYEPHSDESFNLTYYFDATYYKPGGPVIVLQGGETSVADRLPYLQKGIVAQLANATGGIGVILEHRYYGTSFPTENLTTENLRFLTTDQALADQAYFSRNIVFPGLEDQNLTAPGTAHIAYGGSYAGAFVAILRKLYPNDTWGAISSSGVTEAYYDFWQYYEPIREYGPPDCIDIHTKLINVADNILLSNDTTQIDSLKSAFSASNFTYDDDFANSLGSTLGYWQSRNWDPAVSSPAFDEYCGNLTSNITTTNVTDAETSTAQSLISAGGWGNESDTLTTAMLNFMNWYSTFTLGSCNTSTETLDSCFSYHNASASMYTDKTVENYGSLSWPYQYCTQWGFLQSGSTVPKDRLSLISRLVTIEYNMLVCNYAFNITEPAAVDEINQYGGYNLSYSRLGQIGGETDPWRPVTPLAATPLDNSTTDLVNQTSTLDVPLFVIQGAVHHWDENGLFPNETTADLPPQPVAEAQSLIRDAVMHWMDEFRDYCMQNEGLCAYNYTAAANSTA